MQTFRNAVVPPLSAYVLVAVVVLYSARHPAPSPDRRFSWRGRIGLIGVTVGGGFLCFLAIVLVFQVWVVGQRGVMGRALLGGGFLALIAAAAFALLSSLEWRRSR